MYDMGMIAAFTGHRSDELGDDLAGAWIAIKEFLLEARPDRVVSGMALGVDSMAFDIAVELGIPVVAAVPWIGHSSNWKVADREAYLKRLDQACEVKVTSDAEVFGIWVYPVRNRWMVDNSDVLAAVWNGTHKGGTWDAIRYSRSIGREPRLLKWRAR